MILGPFGCRAKDSEVGNAISLRIFLGGWWVLGFRVWGLGFRA